LGFPFINKRVLADDDHRGMINKRPAPLPEGVPPSTASFLRPRTLVKNNKTLDLFELFARERRPMSLTEISRALRVPISSCFNLVKSLQSLGFLYTVEQRRHFFPTHKLFDIAKAIVDSDAWVQRVEEVLKDLWKLTNETILLGKAQNNQLIMLRVIESSQRIRFSAQAGDIVPLLSSAQGRAIVSQMPREEREKLANELPLPKVTPTSVTNRATLMRILDEAESKGYTTINSDLFPDLAAIAKAVAINGTTHSICIAGPSSRIEKNMAKYRSLLFKACRAITEAD